MTAVPIVVASALLAASGAIFGALMARLIWADDLKHAQRIDEIRSRTEGHLKQHIESLQKRIEIYERLK